jgi:hypothetical protein
MAKRTSEQRDAGLRGALLVQAHLMRNRSADGWIPSSRLALAARDEDRLPVDDEEHANALLDDVVGLGLLEEKTPTERGVAGRDLRHRIVRLSVKGGEWYMGNTDPIPGVAHWRESI